MVIRNQELLFSTFLTVSSIPRQSLLSRSMYYVMNVLNLILMMKYLIRKFFQRKYSMSALEYIFML